MKSLPEVPVSSLIDEIDTSAFGALARRLKATCAERLVELVFPARSRAEALTVIRPSPSCAISGSVSPIA